MIRRRSRRVREGEDIDISPLIDMTFLLLIFFMVSTTFVRDRELALDRPSARTAGPANPTATRVVLDRDGAVFVDGDPVQPWMLQSAVRARLSRSGSGDVLVVTDERARSGRLVEVVDQCRLAGARDVAVAVEEPE